MKGLLLMLGWSALAVAEVPPPDDAARHLVFVLQYLETDYAAAVKSGTPSELEEQRLLASELPADGAALGARGQAFRPALAALAKGIAEREAVPQVQRRCRELISRLAEAGVVSHVPRLVPELPAGEQLFLNDCAVCHGQDGQGKVPLARTFSPPPPDLTSSHGRLSPFRVFNAVTLGVEGTVMPAYPSLSESQRWALAHYVMTLGKPACIRAPAPETLDELSLRTDDELAEKHGATEVACLRRGLPSMRAEQVRFAAREVERSLSAARKGHLEDTSREVGDAYLRGFDLAEPLLNRADPELVKATEEGFNQTRRALMENRLGDARRHGAALGTLLERAEKEIRASGGQKER